MTQYWYGVVKDSIGKIRYRKVSTVIAPTQVDFLRELHYDFKRGDVVLELDCGNHMTNEEFVKYVYAYYKSEKRLTVKDIDTAIAA